MRFPGKNRNISSTGDQVDNGTSPRILRLGLMSKENVSSQSGSRKVGRAAGRLSETTVSKSSIIRSRWRTHLSSSGIDFDWNILSGRTSLEMLRKVQEDVHRRNVDPETFGDGIIFMSRVNDIHWNKRHDEKECLSNSQHIRGPHEEVLARTLDVPRTWRRSDMVFTSPKEGEIP